MPVKAKELSAKAIRDLRHPGYGKNHLFPVGGVSGLGLQITPSGARSWILRTMVRGKRRWIGLGPYPEVSLADARTDAKQYKRNVRAGLDTSVEEISFEEAMQRYLATKLREFRNEKHRAQWSSTLERYAPPPHLGPTYNSGNQSQRCSDCSPTAVGLTKPKRHPAFEEGLKGSWLGQQLAAFERATILHAGAATLTPYCQSQAS